MYFQPPSSFINKLSILFLISLTLACSSQAALITFGGSAIVNAKEHDGDDLMAGRLSYLVVDTARDGFSTLLPNTVIKPGAFIPGTNDYVIQTNPTSTGTFGSLVPGKAANFANDANGIDEGDPFRVYFFESSSLDGEGKMSAPLVADEYYGFASSNDWTVPSGADDFYTFTTTGGDENFLRATGISANLQISAIPEPTSAWLLGFASMLYVFGWRRQRPHRRG